MEINSINTRPDIKSTKERSKTTTEQLIKNMLTSHETEYSTLTKNETEQIIKSINKLDINKDRYSKWTEGSIFKLKIKDKDGNVKEYIAAKKRYDNNPNNERNIHKKIEEAINKNAIKTDIKIPKLKAVITVPNGDNFIIMEFIEGKTIYQLELEEIFKKWNVHLWEIKSDIDAETTFFKLLHLDPISIGDREKAQKIYSQERKEIKLFSPEQGKTYKLEIKKFLDIIHKEGIYHRDCSNPRNVIIKENWELYIIDFWKSLQTNNKHTTEKQIYERQEWEKMIGIYPKDEEILTQIHWLTKSNEDIQREKEKNEWKNKINNIKSDKTIFEYLKKIPEKWIKNEETEKEILEKIQKQTERKKQIRLQEMEEADKKELIILLLTQSKENNSLLFTQITNKKRLIEENINKEKEKQNTIPTYTLSGWKEAIERHKTYHEKNIQKEQKQLKKLISLEEKIKYLEKETNI